MSSAGLVESNSRKHGLKRSRLFWVFLVKGMVLLALTVIVAFLSAQWVTFPESGEFTQIYAEKLSEKPTYYVSLSNPDPYLLDAILEPGKFLVFSSLNEMGITEQIGGNSTGNVEFEGDYYTVFVSGGIADFPAPYNRGAPFQLPMVGLWLLWVISAGAVDLHRRQHSQNQLKISAESPS
jgi:hypothetical protein